MSRMYNPIETEGEAGVESVDERNVYSSWMPMSRDGIVAQSALTTCSTNLVHSIPCFFCDGMGWPAWDKGCNLPTERLFQKYLEAWRHHAPAHCRTGPAEPEPEIVNHADRLGFVTHCPSSVNR